MAKVIDITPRLKSVGLGAANPSGPKEVGSNVISGLKVLKFEEQKTKFQPIYLRERRQVERTILSDLISGMIVLPEKGLFKVDLYDISAEGLSFTLDSNMGAFKVDEEVALRVYLNHKTYFPLHVKIKHVTYDQQEEVIRHGVVYHREASADVALQHFVNFIISMNEGLKIDDGDFLASPVS